MPNSIDLNTIQNEDILSGPLKSAALYKVFKNIA